MYLRKYDNIATAYNYTEFDIAPTASGYLVIDSVPYIITNVSPDPNWSYNYFTISLFCTTTGATTSVKLKNLTWGNASNTVIPIL